MAIKTTAQHPISTSDRFELYLSTLSSLMAKAEKQRNPSVWLYKNDARTPVFMLQALAKLLSKISNNKKYTKVKDAAKALEDGLGKIDYWEVFVQEIGKVKNLNPKYLAQAKKHLAEGQHAFNALLIEKGWIKSEQKRINKIRALLQDCKQYTGEKEAKKIFEALQEAIEKTGREIKETNFKFTHVEDHLHEIRRELRWISIYSKAFNGFLQFSSEKTVNATHLKKYQTTSVVKSPFNVMASAGNNTHVILLRKNHFLALSWMIAELGKLKDVGLKAMGLVEVIMTVDKIDEKQATIKAYKILGAKQPKASDLLKQGSLICKKFFEEKVLDGILINFQPNKNAK